VNLSLKDAHVLITRPVHQAENLAKLVEQAGGIAVRFPCLQITGMNLDFEATDIARKLSNAQWLIFTSPNAVNFALQANGGKISQFFTKHIAAIGSGTAKALEHAGLRVDLLPETGFDSEALLATPAFRHVHGQEIIIVRGRGGRDVLANVLSERGAIVDFLEVYKREMPDIDNTQVLDLLKQRKLDGIVITSGEALKNLLVLIGSGYWERLFSIPLITISQRLQTLAADLGFTRTSVTQNPSDNAMLDALIAVTNGEQCG
jgi:uroporphyrinogen-III synthase